MNYEQKNHIGLNYVFDLISPLSGFGKEKYKRLSLYKSSEKADLLTELDNIEIVVSLLRQDKNAFNLIQHALSGMKDITSTLIRLKNVVLSELELFELKLFLALSQQIKEEFEKINKKLGLNKISFHDTKAALELLSLGGNGGFFISDEYSEHLKEIRQKKNIINMQLEMTENQQERDKLRKLHMEIFVKEDKEEEKIRKSLCLQLSEYADKVLLNSVAAANLDILLQKAYLAVKYGMSKPIIGDKLLFKNMLNPMIEEQIEKKFTPISIEAVNGTTVITGANMGGKTVALKTFCLNTCLALYGFFVFAESAEVPMLDFVEITPYDIASEKRNLSNFAADIVNINKLFCRTKKEYGLVLADEFASGTNALEGAKIFRAVVKAFNDSGSMAVMTTHFDEVASVSHVHYQVIGLKDIPSKVEKFNTSDKSVAEMIADYIDYGLIKVPKNAEVPKEALTVCRFLELDEQIMNKL